ncbi:nucleotide exchange factor GrpE [Kineosporia babensis]|uniref:Protein GrpE n=1 Tax=Kineosporia babensis TaxID=499548 RepID=A0A9X1N8Y7_9ACTN|nr:nucleotide exchange factor GrpE [Kineosporia babensis]MCD5309758.1 nucleotide exchange factor GrpE [Kineosporia babensis]
MGEQTVDPSDDQGPSGPVIRDRRRLDPETGEVREESAGSKEPAEAAGQAGKNGGKHAAAAPAAEPDEADGSDTADQEGPAEGTDRADQPEPDENDEKAETVEDGEDVTAEEVSLDGILADLDAARSSAAERLDDLQRLQAEFVNYRRRVDRDRDVAKETAIAGVLEALLPVLDAVHLARQHGDLESGPFAAIAEKLEAVLERFGLARYGEAGEAFDPEVHEALMHTEAELAEGTTTTTVVQVLQPGYRNGDRVLRAARVAVADPN